MPDELVHADGTRPEAWLRFLGALAAFPEGEFEDRFALATRHIRDAGVSHRIYGDDNERTWPLSPLPLILGEEEWAQIAEGVEQRAGLIEAVLSDVYGDGDLISDGHLPAAAVTGSSDFIRAMRGVKPTGGRHMHLYAADLGRGPDGRWWVLDDRTQAPSGSGYALENRLVLSRAFPKLYNAMNVQRLAPFFSDFRDALAEAARRSDPRICLLTPGPFSETYFEQAHLARYLGFLLVDGDDLVVRDGQVYVRTIAGLKRADVIWRRVDADFIDPLELNSASRLGVPGLLEAIRAGGVVVSNMPGSGLLESRALLSFLPALSQRLLGQRLKLPNVATWWCGQPRERTLVESRINTLAIANAFNGQGHPALAGGPRLLADLSEADRVSLLEAMQERPVDFVGQEVVRLSTTPAWRDGTLQPSPFVLRVFAAATPDGGWRIMPGGFCRVSDQKDARAISMGQGAQAADVWVLSEQPVEGVSLMIQRDDVKVRRIMGNLPSRAADNLFWLGRYLERAEATLRLVRSLCTSLMDSDAALHGGGETLAKLQGLLLEWGAVAPETSRGKVTDFAISALHDDESYGSVIRLIRAARRTAASMRERLSEDFWKLLQALERSLAGKRSDVVTEAEGLARAEAALQALATLSGLTQENMNRVAGWRFLDMGRRIERGVNTCRIMRQLAEDDATLDDLDLLLDLVDSQITYRSRYMVGMALTPVRDLVMLDPFQSTLGGLPGDHPARAFRSPAHPAGRRHARGAAAAGHPPGQPGRHRGRGRTGHRQGADVRTDADGRVERRVGPLLPAGVQRHPNQEAGRTGLIYQLRHLTTYLYEQPVTFARCALRLSPHQGADQTVLESRLQITPTPTRIEEHVGQFGETVVTAIIETPHRELEILATSRVDVMRPVRALPLGGAPWEAVREEGFETTELGLGSPAHFLYPTPMTAKHPAITAYAAQSFTHGRPVIEAAHELACRIKAGLRLRLRLHRRADPGDRYLRGPARGLPGLRPDHDQRPARPGAAHGLCQRLPAHLSGARPAAPGRRRRHPRLDRPVVRRSGRLDRLRPDQCPRRGRGSHRAGHRPRLRRRRADRRRGAGPGRPDDQGRRRCDPGRRSGPGPALKNPPSGRNPLFLLQRLGSPCDHEASLADDGLAQEQNPRERPCPTRSAMPPRTPKPRSARSTSSDARCVPTM